MKVLLVEDAADFADELLDLLSDTESVTVVGNRTSAFAALAADWFDVVVCDLRIPASDGSIETAPEHGTAVLDEIRRVAPGTIAIAFSAYGTLEIVQRIHENPVVEDVFGDRKEIKLADFLKKSQLIEFEALVADYAERFKRLDEIEIETGIANLQLDPLTERVLKICANRHDGRIVHAQRLSGGLSDATVLRVRVETGAGGTAASLVARVDRLHEVADEAHRYNTHVAPKLGIGSYAPLVEQVKAGCADFGGLFYTLAQTYDRSLFQLLAEDEAAACDAVLQLREMLAPWRDEVVVEPDRTVQSVRALLSSDDVASSLAIPGVSIAELEACTFQAHSASQHADLHGANILVKPPSTPVLIDYAAVMRAPIALDPLTLELSLLFHPDATAIRNGWPAVPQARSWRDLDVYLVDCPVPNFVRACREWATDGSAGRERAAVAYSYAVRQFKYDGTDKGLAVAVVQGAADHLLTA